MQIELKCDNCNRDLDYNVRKVSEEIILDVEPCNYCLESEREEGYEEGHNAGYEEGKDSGHDAGYDEGFEDGHDQGLKERE